MAWIRIDDNAPHHRKMLDAGPAACWLWVCGLGYGQRLNTDFIPEKAVPLLGVGSYRKLAGFLVAAGLWHRVEGGYRIHDFHDFHATPEERAEYQEKRRGRNQRYYQRLKTESQDGLKTRLKTASQDGEPEPNPKPEPKPEGITAAPSPPPPTLVRKRKPWNYFEGVRIEVPQGWHEDHVRRLGLADAEAKLLAWYGELDGQLVRSQRPVGNWFKWLDACYEPWATDLAVSDELEKFRPKGA